MADVKIYLIERKRKLPSGKRTTYFVLRWADHRGEFQQEAVGKAAKSGGTVTAAQAKEARLAKEQAINSGRAFRSKPQRMKVSEFIDEHIQTVGPMKSHGTVIEWKVVRKHIIESLDDPPLEDLQWSDAGRIKAHLADRSPATVRKTILTFRGLLNHAVKRQLIVENPFRHEELGPMFEREKRIFSKAETDAMETAAESSWWETVIRLAVTSGLRKCELLHLRWHDLDLDAGTVRVEPHHAARVKVGGDEAPIFEWRPKTKRSRRTVPIPSGTVELLLELRRELRFGGSPYVFMDMNRLRKLDGRLATGMLPPNFDPIPQFTKRFNQIQVGAAAALGEDDWKRGCFHDLRKTFGTRAATAGVPIHELRDHMGHASITTTADYYTGVDKTAADRLRQAVA